MTTDFGQITTVAFAKNRESAAEDAWGHSADGRVIAIADGASSAWESGRWAEHLVAAWLESAGDSQTLVGQARSSFSAAVPAESGAAEGLGWLHAAAADRGSFSAFLGVALRTQLPNGDWRWEATGRGDVTLFHLDEFGTVSRVWPDPAGHGFGSHPDLIASVGPTPELRRLHGLARPSDTLLIASDAVAAGLCRDPKLIRAMAVESAVEVGQRLRAAAKAGDLEADDLTLLRYQFTVDSVADRTG